jgi:hypothetical protein
VDREQLLGGQAAAAARFLNGVLEAGDGVRDLPSSNVAHAPTSPSGAGCRVFRVLTLAARLRNRRPQLGAVLRDRVRALLDVLRVCIRRDRIGVRVEDVAAHVLDHPFGDIASHTPTSAKPLMLLSFAGEGQIDPNSVSEAAWSGSTHFVLAPPRRRAAWRAPWRPCRER